MNDFLKHLRDEKLETQKRRFGFIKLKFLLALGLMGFGVLKIGGEGNYSILLYFAPFVAITMDLYILGEDFGVKRIGHFLRTYGLANNEQRWETFVNKNRDPFTFVGKFWVSSVIFVASWLAIELLAENDIRESHQGLHLSWIIVNCLLLIIIFISSVYIPKFRKWK